MRLTHAAYSVVLFGLRVRGEAQETVVAEVRAGDRVDEVSNRSDRLRPGVGDPAITTDRVDLVAAVLPGDVHVAAPVGADRRALPTAGHAVVRGCGELPGHRPGPAAVGGVGHADRLRAPRDAAELRPGGVEPTEERRARVLVRPDRVLVVEREAAGLRDGRRAGPGRPVVGAARDDDELRCLVSRLLPGLVGGQALVVRVGGRSAERPCRWVVARPVHDHRVAVADVRRGPPSRGVVEQPTVRPRGAVVGRRVDAVRAHTGEEGAVGQVTVPHRGAARGLLLLIVGARDQVRRGRIRSDARLVLLVRREPRRRVRRRVARDLRAVRLYVVGRGGEDRYNAECQRPTRGCCQDYGGESARWS